jgi:hypothetical protein|uniref:Uncharacterized protein n=1 Tax=Zea mays TaxID=4577 RepID=A0A804N5F7_MAIZE
MHVCIFIPSWTWTATCNSQHIPRRRRAEPRQELRRPPTATAGAAGPVRVRLLLLMRRDGTSAVAAVLLHLHRGELREKARGNDAPREPVCEDAAAVVGEMVAVQASLLQELRLHLEREVVVVVALQRGLERGGGRCGREAEVGQLRLHAGDGLGRRHGRARRGGGGRGGGGGGGGRGGGRRGARAATAGGLLAGALGVAPAPAADGHVAERAAAGPVAAARLAEVARLRERVVVKVAELGVGGVAARAAERAGLRERHAHEPGALRHRHDGARLRRPRPCPCSRRRRHRGGRAASRWSARRRVSRTSAQRRQAGRRRHQVVVVAASTAVEETLEWLLLLHMHLYACIANQL